LRRLAGKISTPVPLSSSGLSRRKWRFAGAALVVFVLAGLVVGWFAWHQATRSKVSQSLATPQRLTSNPTENPVSAVAISVYRNVQRQPTTELRITL